jgi:hypothetical protein
VLRRILVVAALLVPSLLVAAPASAEPVCLVFEPRTRECLEWGDDDGNGDGGEDGELRTPDTEVNGVACYFSEITDPQPFPWEPFWNPHRDADGNPVGVSLNCTYDPENRGYRWRYWALQPPGGVAQPDPEDLAREALATLELEPIEIGIVPDPAATGAIGYIGWPVWGWAANPGAATQGPLTAEASQGPFTVTVTAEVDRLVWDWGDGIVTECPPPGTPYEDRFGKATSPDCGHEGYSKQGDKHVTVTAVWRIEWEGMGRSGELDPREVPSSADITVGELQVISR